MSNFFKGNTLHIKVEGVGYDEDGPFVLLRRWQASRDGKRKSGMACAQKVRPGDTLSYRARASVSAHIKKIDEEEQEEDEA